MKYLLLIACLITVFVSCDDDTKVCDLDTRTEVRLRYRWNNPKNKDIEEDTIMPAVTLFALGKDSILRKQTGLSGMQFPLDRLADSSRFYFRTDTVATVPADTITFRYTRQPHFVSAGCGIVMYFTIDTVLSTSRVIKRVQLNSPNITTGNEINILLHF